MYEIAIEIDDKENSALALAQISYLCFKQMKYQEADKICLSIKSIYPDKIPAKVINFSFNQYGMLYYYIGKYEQGIEFIEVALAESYKLGEQIQIAGILSNLSVMYMYSGKYRKAQETLLTAIKIRFSLNDYVGLATSYNQLANFFYRKGDTSQAMENYLKAFDALAKVSSADEHASMKVGARITNNIANLYKESAEYKKALEYYQESLRMKLELNDEADTASVLGNIASVYNRLEDYKNAAIYFKKSLSLCDKHKLDVSASTQLLNLGTMYYDQQKYDAALVHYKKSEVLRRSQGDPYALVRILSAISATYIKIEDFVTAKTILMNL